MLQIVAEEREVLLLECATHIKMARAQRCLYQAKVEQAVTDAKAVIEHEKKPTHSSLITVKIWSFRSTIPSSLVAPIITVL